MHHVVPRFSFDRSFALRTGIATAVALALASCGGAGSDSAAFQNSLGVSGIVVDGPIQGATVFLDLNRNSAHDEGEPLSLPTGADGAFRLEVSNLTQAQIAAAMLVTHVPDNARDSDDGGLTLAEAGRAGFALMTPAAAYIPAEGTMSPAVLSPITTLVAGEMVFNGLTMDEAKAAVQDRLALPGRDVMANFVAEGDAAMGNIARAMAIAMGEAGRAISQVATQEGGIAVSEQLASVMKVTKGQIPTVIADLQLGEGSAQRPAVGAVKSLLASGDSAEVLAKAVNENRRAAGVFHDYVVVFREDVGNSSAKATELMQGRGGNIRFTYSNAVKGFAVTLPEAAADAFLAAMEQNPNVDYVEVDKPVSLSQTTQSNATWGLDRSDQRNLPLSGSYTYTASGAGVRAYVVDSGILGSHTDFGGRAVAGYSAINDGNGTTDCNGHGTHVAGTIAGTSWGIAKGASVVPVRVLGCDGSGTMSGVLAGLDWIAANAVKPAVVNMSLGGAASSTLDAAVANMSARGIPVVVSAGNSNANACNYSPAREPSAITIGATTNSDSRASYSNFGTCLDLFAPGSAITSAWISSSTSASSLSGTSMAAPHVSGLVAQYLQLTPGASVAQVTDAVKNAATTGKVADAGSGSPNLLLFTGAATSTETAPSPTIVASINSLTGSGAVVRNGWRATVSLSVKDANGAPVPGATVAGGFTVGGSSVSCKTSTNGACSITSGNISKSTTATTFTVREISGTNMTYNATANLSSSVIVRRP